MTKGFVFSCEIDPDGKKPNQGNLMVFWPTAIFDKDAFLDTIEQYLTERLRPNCVILIMRDVIFNTVREQLKEDPYIRARLSETPLKIVGYNKNGDRSKSEDLFQDHPSEVDMESFKRAAIIHIFTQHQGFVEATKVYHFENPSKRHSSKFIRLANILRRAEEISFLAFCCLPFFTDRTKVVYVDTSSLHLIVFAILEQLRSFDSSLTLFPINFESYFSLSEGEFNFQYAAESIVLLSASTSGGLAKRLMTDYQFDSNQIVQFLYLGKNEPETNVVCNLTKNGDFGFEPIFAREAADCEYCKRYSIPIPILSDQFVFAGPQQSPLKIIEANQHEDSKNFWECATGNQALSIVFPSDSSDSCTTHFFIDLTKLLEEDSFRKRLDYLLARSFPARARLIVTTQEDTGHIAEYIQKHIGGKTRVSKINDLKQKEIDINGDAPVVVVADAVESGISLQDLSRRLRKISDKAPLIYFIGVSKSSGDKSRENLRSTLTFAAGPAKHIYEVVHSVRLPRSSKDNSWSQERQLIMNPEFSGIIEKSMRPYFDKRKEILASSKPCLNELFVPNLPEGRMQLQPGFAFWKGLEKSASSEADVFFTIASVLQNIRALGKSDEPHPKPAIRSNWLQQTLIDPTTFSRFNDPIIQACFLRAASAFEQNYSADEELSLSMANIVLDALSRASSEPAGSASEFLLALITKRLQLSENSIDKIKKASVNQDSITGAFHSYLRTAL